MVEFNYYSTLTIYVCCSVCSYRSKVAGWNKTTNNRQVH